MVAPRGVGLDGRCGPAAASAARAVGAVPAGAAAAAVAAGAAGAGGAAGAASARASAGDLEPEAGAFDLQAVEVGAATSSMSSLIWSKVSMKRSSSGGRQPGRAAA